MISSHRFNRSVRAIALAMLLHPAAGLTANCPDLLMTEDRLEKILDDALGPLKAAAQSRSVSIAPDSACYLKMTVDVNTALVGLPGLQCSLSGCSTALFDDQRIGIQRFDVAGCEFAFQLLRLPPRVNAAYADASKDIAQHCGSAAFRIAGVKPERNASGGVGSRPSSS